MKKILSQTASVAVVVSLMLSFLPFMKGFIGWMFDTYEEMADSVLNGTSYEYTSGLLDNLESASKNIIEELDVWSSEIVEQLQEKQDEDYKTEH